MLWDLKIFIAQSSFLQLLNNILATANGHAVIGRIPTEDSVLPPPEPRSVEGGAYDNPAMSPPSPDDGSERNFSSLSPVRGHARQLPPIKENKVVNRSRGGGPFTISQVI